jgi:chorismate mutase
MWEGILSSNQNAIEGAFDLLEQSLADVRAAFEKGGLAELWSRVSNRRKLMTPESLPRARKPELRKLIDRYDEQILKALSNRMRIAKKIGQDKADKDTPVHDPDRERRLLAKRQQWAKAGGLPPDLIESLFKTIMEYSKQLQSRETKKD